MPTTINPTITDAGLAAAIDADTSSLQVQITHVAIGSGYYAVTGSETSMASRRETVAVASGSVDAGGAVAVSVIFPSYAGAPYEAKEIGFYLGDPDAGGILFAVYSSDTSFVYRTTLDFIAQFTLGLTSVPAGSVAVSVDPDAAILHLLIEDHKIDPSPHPAYVKNSEQVGMGGVFFMEVPPDRWMVANGAAVSRTAYPELYARIGTRYGVGDGSTTFNLPNAQDRMILGAGSTFSFATYGGNKDAIVVEHTHGISVAPNHTHSVNLQSLNSNSDVGYGRIATGGAGAEGVIPDITSSGSGAHSHTAATVGASGVDANMPPYVTALICIKYH